MPQVTINSQECDFPEATSILEACRALGIEIPALCHDERLKPIGSCRICLVQISGQLRPAPACNTQLIQGMDISTQTPALENERQMLLRMVAQDHPDKSLALNSGKAFYRTALDYGLNKADFNGRQDPDLIDDSHPYIHVDMSHCILCLRCVRICDEVQGQNVWQVVDKGSQTRIIPDSGTTLRESSCVSCGACVDTCPTAALEDKSILERGIPTDWTRTTCAYCGTGCEMTVGTINKQIVSIKPVLEAPVNKGHLCVKGRYAFDFVSAPDRITHPMVRQNGTWQAVSWEEAIAYTASRLEQVLTRFGPDSTAILGSARSTNEENYLTQKFARVVLGTNNLDCCARVCHTPTAAAMKLMLGTGAATNSYNDIEQAQTILICGANATENHPVIGARIKQAARNGANLIVIDPRRIELASFATIHLRPRPGTNIPLLNSLAWTIIEEQLVDEEFTGQRAAEVHQFSQFIREFSPERAANVCGIRAELIREAARLYAQAKPAICFHGLGITEHTQGTEGVMCLVNLALLTGNIGMPGTGINPLRGQNNVQGAAHMGCDPGILTGSVSLRDGRELFESVWRTPIPTTSGFNLLEMMDAATEGKLKALWTIGYDVAFTNANAIKTAWALNSLDLVIVQDLFLNETARQFGSVFLPATSSFERDGTFMNAERRIQRIRKVIEPVGRAKSDWEIICSVAQAMSKSNYFDYASAEEIWNEIRRVWPQGQGITYSRLDHRGLQWPCLTEDHPGTEVLHSEDFPIGTRAALRRVPYVPTSEIVDQEFPFLLMTGRTLYQFNAGTMTMRTPDRELRPADLLDIAPEDAAQLKLRDGDFARIRSRYGEAILPVRITPEVNAGAVFATFHTVQVFLNRVTGPHRDRYVNTPEYKVTAVEITKDLAREGLTKK